MAELFTNSAEIDIEFSKKLNINGMIRDIMTVEGGRNLGEYFHWLTCQDAPVGQIKHHQDQILIARRTNQVIFDMTHDNKSPLDRFGNRLLHLPLANLIASSDQIVATTWGFDQMLLKNFCVVRESRLYPVQQI